MAQTAKKRGVTTPQRRKVRSNIVSMNQLSKIFGYDPKSLRQFRDDGMPIVTESTGGNRQVNVDTIVVHKWLVTRALGGSETPLFAARLKKTQEEHKKLEIENQVREGILVEAEGVKDIFAEVMITLRNSLEGAAGRIAKGNVPHRKRLLEEVRKIERAYGKALTKRLREISNEYEEE